MKASTLLGIIVLAACFLMPLRANAQIEQLYGTWRLVSWTREVVGTGERTEIFGKAPQGFLTYNRDGRMSAIIVRENRPKPTDLTKLTDQERAELFKSMVAYAGTFKVEGSRVVHNVDISWNENWTGTAQVRSFRIEGRTLTIRTEPAGTVLIWEKVE
jgi:hypothetical protein